MVYTLAPSTRQSKKWQITSPDGKTLHFGANGYSDYTLHKDSDRMARYITRHSRKVNGKPVENWKKSGLATPGFWARWILWNKPSLNASIRDTEKRFGIKIKSLKPIQRGSGIENLSETEIAEIIKRLDNRSLRQFMLAAGPEVYRKIKTSDYLQRILKWKKMLSQAQFRIDSAAIHTTNAVVRQIVDTRAPILVMSRMGLLQLPREIGELTYLRSLDLSQNQLTDLPSTMAQLTNLRGLNLSENNFAHVPPVVFQLPELERLNLNHSGRLRSLPDQIVDLPKLKKLTLGPSVRLTPDLRDRLAEKGVQINQ